MLRKGSAWRRRSPTFCTRTFAAPVITIERKDDADPSHGGASARPWPDRHGRRIIDLRNQSAADDLSREDWLGLLIDREVTARDHKRLGRRLSVARLRQNAVVEDTDLRTPRGLDRGLFQTLATCGWIRDSQHLLIGGPTGTGKSWLACALGHKACREGFSVLYRRAPRLFADLATARGEGRLARLMRNLERTRLLIIDDWGPEPLTAEQRRDLLEIVDDRDGRGSLLITSQVPVARWHEIIGDPTLADAILDRVVHRAHRIELKGDSLRKRQTPAAAEGLTKAKET